MRPNLRSKCARIWLNELIRQSVPQSTSSQEPYWQLIQALQRSTRLLCLDDQSPKSLGRVVEACVRLAQFQADWKRPLTSWSVSSTGLHDQMRSLIEHLLAGYSVPRFLVWAWLEKDRQDWERQLYVHLGRGQSIRQFPTLLSLSKSAARCLMQAPDDLRPIPALRWAQVRACGR
jgi:hypothetical protein